MIHLTRKQNGKIISLHHHWVKRDCRGLINTDLSGVNLEYENPSFADMPGTNLPNTYTYQPHYV